VIFTTGKRKRAVARSSMKPGKGLVKVNSVPLELVKPDMLRLRIQEPMLLMGDAFKGYDIRVKVRGGGPMGQAEAARQAIAKGMAEALGSEARAAFLQYDRSLMVYDPRRTETHKPPHSSWGARRYKQRSKR
jgi:small subunit ribosomal protein S9